MSSLHRRRSPPPSQIHYDYLLKIILLGPSGSGKTSLLHHFLHAQPLLLSSQTIGVEFSSKILVLGTGARKKRIKLQLWDTAGTERFRSVSRSYYRGAAGAVLVWDITSERSFREAETFLRDARVLGSRGLSVVGVGNKLDVADESTQEGGMGYEDADRGGKYSASVSSRGSRNSWASAGDGEDFAGKVREVELDRARAWAAQAQIPVVMETSALTGEGVQEVFERLARMILTKIELGEVNPDDPNSGIQYGDSGGWGIDADDGRSLKSGMTIEDGGSLIGYSGQKLRRNNVGIGKGWVPGRGGCC
ncbi:putative GTP-binding protein ypt4 [Elsinoe fawcettii]|nr:putative GTP-binding protein ypt4 [Elsinoe fawcettii]